MAESHLAPLHAYFDAVIESSDETFLAGDLEGVIVACNSAAEHLLGYTAAELVGQSALMLVPPERRHEEAEILDRVRRGERVAHFESACIAKSGRVIPVWLTVSPVRAASGEVVGSARLIREMTALRQAEEAQAYLASIVEFSDDAIISKDLDGIIRSWNAAAERMFGYTAAEMVGRSIKTLIPPDRHAEETEILRRLRRGERIDHFETIRVAKDGRLLDISLTVSPIRTASGEIVGASKVARDITERRGAARELAAQHEWFRVTLGSIGDAVIASDPEGRVTFMNTTAERLTGWRMSQAVGKPLTEVFHIVDERMRQPLEIPTEKVIRSGQILGLPNNSLLIARDGSECPIADSAAPILDEQKEILGVVLVFRDVREQRRAEDAVGEQREWFETTLESIGDAVIATDVLGQVVFMNPVAEHLTGWRSIDARGRPSEQVFRILHEQTRRPVRSPVARVLEEGRVVGLANQTVLVARDGKERPIDDSGAPIRNRRGHIIGVVLVFRDVSERRHLEGVRQLAAAERERLLESERAARGEAERANRVKDDFVAMVSHELRTPLNAILGWADLLLNNPVDAKTLQHGLEVVARNTRAQAQLISDLLDISHIVSGKLRLEIETIDLRELIEESVETVQQSADAKGVQIERRLESGLEPMAGDPARIQQIVWNLLSNAIKFTPQGGEITVGLRRVDSKAEITVVDNGYGIRPELLPGLFERFRQGATTTRRFGGLGLGLSITRHLVELHGGTVRAASEGEDKGARFSVELPLTAPSPTVVRGSTGGAKAEAQAMAADVSLRHIKVLVVEDEADTRDLIGRILAAHHAEVVTAGSVPQALEVLVEERPDILLSDIGLPDFDGYDLIQRVRRRGDAIGSIPAVALTAFARTEDRTRALSAGYQTHIAKPIEPADLVLTIASLAELVAGRRQRATLDAGS